ncbi:polysaccharide deacetylase family protein [Chloroflexota bacterium]
MTERTELIVTTSWDDGTVTDLKLAGLLDKYGLSGTFYICRASSIPDLISETDITALDKTFEIGAHTMTHPHLVGIPVAEASKEIQGSKAYLEDLLGHEVSMFCYPFGLYNDAVADIVKTSGFTGARTCQPAGFGLSSDPYRFGITLFVSDGSPLMALRIWLKARLLNIRGLFDWETRAKLLFDLASKKGGIYHIYGHSVEFEENNEWDKLERVFSYISNKAGGRYSTNGEVMRLREEKDKL